MKFDGKVIFTMNVYKHQESASKNTWKIHSMILAYLSKRYKTNNLSKGRPEVFQYFDIVNTKTKSIEQRILCISVN